MTHDAQVMHNSKHRLTASVTYVTTLTCASVSDQLPVGSPYLPIVQFAKN